jgi:hypothetical protein
MDLMIALVGVILGLAGRLGSAVLGQASQGLQTTYCRRVLRLARKACRRLPLSGRTLG